jgi:methanethiol S-methyltransferase
MHRIGVFIYGVFAYACFLATFLYAMGFVGGFGVPRSIDSAANGPLGVAVVVNLLLFWQWRPIGGLIWRVENPVGQAALYGLFGAGWLAVLVATFLINHFDLFGLRQVWLYLRGEPYRPPGFVTPGLYRYVRHPLYMGWLLAFWATPTMTAAHLLFAVTTTAYILVAIRFEERDLGAVHGARYAEYRRSVPMLVPRLRPTQPVATRLARSEAA